eukprot:1158598-Pelagomonas_calceolata.AAC.6
MADLSTLDQSPGLHRVPEASLQRQSNAVWPTSMSKGWLSYASWKAQITNLRSAQRIKQHESVRQTRRDTQHNKTTWVMQARKTASGPSNPEQVEHVACFKDHKIHSLNCAGAA